MDQEIMQTMAMRALEFMALGGGNYSEPADDERELAEKTYKELIEDKIEEAKALGLCASGGIYETCTMLRTFNDGSSLTIDFIKPVSSSSGSSIGYDISFWDGDNSHEKIAGYATDLISCEGNHVAATRNYGRRPRVSVGEIYALEDFINEAGKFIKRPKRPCDD